MIDLLYPVYFQTFDPNLSAGEKNPGGGMATKMLSVKQVLSSRYLVNLVGDIRDVVSNVVVIEPLTPRLSLEEKDFAEWLNQLSACSAKKILYCSEMEICRWSPNFFNEIVELVDVVTANTKYQESIIRTLSGGKVNPTFLCDPIDEFLFQPLQPKKVSIFGAGRISTIKNSEFYIELFKAIKKNFNGKIETAYFGSADLWGQTRKEDKEIERDIETYADTFLGGIPRKSLAQKFGYSLLYASKTTHDVYSSTHVETLASGCISLGGGHPMFAERPGFSGLRTVEKYLEVIEVLLSSPESELNDMQRNSRHYVCDNCGFKAFLRQFDLVMRELM